MVFQLVHIEAIVGFSTDLLRRSEAPPFWVVSSRDSKRKLLRLFILKRNSHGNQGFRQPHPIISSGWFRELPLYWDFQSSLCINVLRLNDSRHQLARQLNCQIRTKENPKLLTKDGRYHRQRIQSISTRGRGVQLLSEQFLSWTSQLQPNFGQRTYSHPNQVFTLPTARLLEIQGLNTNTLEYGPAFNSAASDLVPMSIPPF